MSKTPRSLSGKVAVITGGARGIGLAVVERLLQAGANVAFCARSQPSVDIALNHLKHLSSGDKVFGAPADVRSTGNVEEFMNQVRQTYGAPDILVNNAGIGTFKAAGDFSPAEWEELMGTNLTGVFNFCRAVLPEFRRNPAGGQIVNISSLAGKNAFAGGAVYNASKFGLNGFTEALMLDYRQENIRVSLIAPGSVDTDFSPRSSGTGSTSWKIAPEDVAEAVLGVLHMPARTLVSLVELRPSKPKK